MEKNDPLVLGRVVGDVLNPFKRSVDLDVFFKLRKVNNGSEYKPSDIVSKPRVRIGGDDWSKFYTLVMIDPDAPNPSDPIIKEYLHWLITDIPGTTGTPFGNDVVCYNNPTPTIGIHRYVFVLFQQLGRDTVYRPEFRHNFNTLEFAKNYNLGSPVSAVYFNCQREKGSGGRKIQT
ncbi:Protein HEADING DATE 3A [Zostera marina]|uniref:Protein HEADING DATE 3A n=1 Tax=Zostera marina TaxID=29655 RepID=A0A0K9PUA3_ZOSMR|nr:Protein HEADING DATE 3A [Zostera marina]